MKFTDILDEHGITYRGPEEDHHCSIGWIQFLCPYCGVDPSAFHIGYNLASGYVNCWKCGPLNPIAVLSEITELGYGECARNLSNVDYNKSIKRPNPGKLKMPRNLGPLLDAHKRYLRDRRGFNIDNLLSLWRIKGIGISHELPWRIWIPICFMGGVVSWTTRSIGHNPPRYISARADSESMHHKDLLYGEDFCRHACIVHEGPTDVWKTGPGAVAIFGMNASRSQVEKISRYPVRTICFDNNMQAQKKARRLCDELTVFPGLTYNFLLDSEDAGCASSLELRELRKLLY